MISDTYFLLYQALDKRTWDGCWIQCRKKQSSFQSTREEKYMYKQLQSQLVDISVKALSSLHTVHIRQLELFRYHIGYRHIGISANFGPYWYRLILVTNMYRYWYKRKQKKWANFRVWKMQDIRNFGYPAFISMSYHGKCNPNLIPSPKANTR